MIGTVILCALLAALFWGVITGRLRLPPEEPKPEPQPYVWGSLHAPGPVWDCSLLVDDARRRARITHVHWTIVPPKAKPFDWSQHPDL